MKLPDTQNANHQYAFKKGYRLAQEGKSLSHMPSSIRHDGKMREYFQQGWTQFENDFAMAQSEQESPWKNRIIIGFMMILSGIGTAALMIHNIHEENKSLTEKTSAPVTQTTQSVQPTITSPKNPSPSTQETAETLPRLIKGKATATEIETTKIEEQPQPTTPLSPKPSTAQPAEQSLELSLLSHAARRDLQLNRQAEQAQRKQATQVQQQLATPIIASPIKILTAQLTSQVKNKQAIDTLGQPIPKYIRKVFFFTQVNAPKPMTIYHRWIYKNQIMVTTPLKIKAGAYRTWSSKRMSSAWQGQWQVEILDNQKHPIYRQNFKYIK